MMTRDASILTKENIKVSAKLSSKEKVIEFIVQKLYMQKFIIEPFQIMDHIYRRELSGKTGLIKGISIPHVRHNSVLEPVLYVLRLKKPIEWGTLDDSLVNIVLFIVSTKEKINDLKEAEIMNLMHSFAEEETFENLQKCYDENSLYMYLHTLISNEKGE